MKAKLIAITSCLVLFISNNSFADCSSFFSGTKTNCRNNGGYQAYYEAVNGYQSDCVTGCCEYDTVCQCTDPGVNYNYCIDRCTYCEAFGNIGAR